MKNNTCLFGRRAVLEALLAGKRNIERIVLARGLKGETFREIIAEAEKKGIRIEELERKRLNSISGTEFHQGVVAVSSPIESEDVATILWKAYEKGEDPFILIVDGITDPQNLGALIRSAEVAGAHGVILPEESVAPLDRATAKASAGAVEYISVCTSGNLGQAILHLKDQGVKVYSALLSVTAPLIYDIDMTGGIAIVIGAEDKGVSNRVQNKCSGSFRIPMKGKVKSLNASAAGAIAMFEVVRQRHSIGRR